MYEHRSHPWVGIPFFGCLWLQQLDGCSPNSTRTERCRPMSRWRIEPLHDNILIAELLYVHLTKPAVVHLFGPISLRSVAKQHQ